MLAFATVVHQLGVSGARERIVQQASLCAIVLQGAPHDALAAHARQLIDGYDQLLGLATVTADRRPAAVYPETPAVRSAAMMTLVQSGIVGLSLGSEETPAWGIEVPLREGSPDTSQHVVLIFARQPQWGLLAMKSLLFGLVLACIASLVAVRMNHAVTGRLTRPLQNLVAAVRTPVMADSLLNQLEQDGLHEVQEVAVAFRRLADEVTEAKARARRVEQTSRHLIDQSESLFNQKLRRAKDQATTDPLTRLRNRRFLQEELDPIFDQQRRRAKDLSVIMLDLDNFKQLNDTKGHNAGDELLHFTGALLRGAVRPEDFAARYGGDEFVLLLPDTTCEGARQVAERIVRLFAQYTASVLQECRQVTMSAGIASIGQHPYLASGRDLMAKADEALYEAKHAGKNAVVAART